MQEAARETEPRRFSEPHLAVHPADPSRLLVGVFILASAGTTEEQHAGQRCATFASRDAGRTWTRHEFPFADCGDPQVAILPNGQAVFVGLAELPNVLPKRQNWLFAFHSADGGTTWDAAPTVIGRPHDHPAIAIDTASSRKGLIYVTTHHEPRDADGQLTTRIFLVRSRDSGQSFDPSTTIMPNNLHNFGEMPAVLADGTVFASFVDDAPAQPSFPRRRAWVVRSADGGATFSPPLFVNDVCGSPPSFQLSALAADTSSGPFRDRLYFACRQNAGGPVVVTASGDRGHAWNRPGVAVGPADTDTLARRVMTLAVNKEGVLGVLTVQRKPGTDPCLMTDFSASLDGGATFSAPSRVSASSCGTSPADEIAGRMIPTYGDYHGLAAMPDGRFIAMWPEMSDGHSVLRTATIEVEGRVAAPAAK